MKKIEVVICGCGYSNDANNTACLNCGCDLESQNMPIGSFTKEEIIERTASDATKEQKRGALRMWGYVS
jgi:hypothetical protein